jgi:6-pyruvoyltetrahydropterin/6-carboxytetrahydropterin synthase
MTNSTSTHIQARIGRSYHFSAAHRLPLVAEDHKCRNMHGHNYRIEVIICGVLDRRGFVKDFAELDAEVLPLIARLDHRILNDVEGLENPTAEFIASWLIQRIAGCECVRVYETDESWAEVTTQPVGLRTTVFIS